MRRELAVMTMTLMLGFGYATTVAAQPTSAPTQSGDMGNDRGNGFDMGWLGLLGLAGLMGLKRDNTARHGVPHTSPVR